MSQFFKVRKVSSLTILSMVAVLFFSARVNAQSDTAPSPLSLDALSNATYLSAHAEGDKVTLEGGSYVSDAGTSDEVNVALTGYLASGDLTGDGVEDAAVVIETDTAGTARFYELAVLVAEEGQPVNIATTDLGDRIILDDLWIEDGKIMVAMTNHAPGDADCCPTQSVQVTFELVDDELSQISEEADEQDESAGLFSPDEEPTVATLTLGGSDSYWLDPTLIALHSGASTGAPVDASTLGSGCTGTINERPEVVLQWSEDTQIETLRIFFLSMGDPALAIVTPSGEVLCNDDLNPLMLDPYITIPEPVSGRYAIYLANFASKTATPGFLVVTSQQFSPATMDIAQLFPRQINPGAVGESKPIEVLQPDAPIDDAAVISLTEVSAPLQVAGVAGGELGAYEIELNNALCTGFISAAPTYRLEWGGAAENLVLFFEGDADTTLVVRDSEGIFQCNDDADGARNLNPYLSLQPVTGTYDIWVGSFAPTTPVSGTLTVATTTDLQPEALKSSE